MAEKYGFFNSKNGDRTYDAEDMNRQLRRLVSDGVFANPSTNLQVTAGSGMTVTVSPGGARVDGHWYELDAPVNLTVSPADVSLERTDAVVLSLDRKARSISLKVVKGAVPAHEADPVRNDDEYQLILAYVFVYPRTSVIKDYAVLDVRGRDCCGYITGLINQVDTSRLFGQYDAAAKHDQETNQQAFTKWFAGVQKQLAGAVPYKTLSGSSKAIVNLQSGFTFITDYTPGTDILNVYVNGLRLVESEYYIKNNMIMLKQSVKKGTEVSYEVLRYNDAFTETETWKDVKLSGSLQGSVKVKKTGDIVSIQGQIIGAVSQGSVLFTLDEQHRPAMMLMIPCSFVTDMDKGTLTNGLLNVLPNGQVTAGAACPAGGIIPILINFSK